MKTCTKCKVCKDEFKFHKRKTGKDGLNAMCKQCTNIAARCKRYGLSTAEFEGLMLRQANLCAMCLEKHDLVVDHNHSTKMVRGLLCGQCNSAIGSFNEDSLLLQEVYAYLNNAILRWVHTD
jgi:hypothetical protein